MKKSTSIILSFLLAFNSLSLARPTPVANPLSKKIADHIQLKFMDKKNLKDLLPGTLASAELKKELIKLAEKKKVNNQPLPKMSVSLVAEGVKFTFDKTYNLFFKEADQSFWMNGQRIKMKESITAEELYVMMSDALNPIKNTTSLFNVLVQPAYAIDPITITIVIVAVLFTITAAAIVHENNEAVKDGIKRNAKGFLESNLRDLQCTSEGSEKPLSLPTKFKFRDVHFDITYGQGGNAAEVKFSNCVLKVYRNGNFQVPTQDCENKVKNFLDSDLARRSFFRSYNGKYYSSYLEDLKRYCSSDSEGKIFQTEQASFIKLVNDAALNQKRREQDEANEKHQREKDGNTLIELKPQTTK